MTGRNEKTKRMIGDIALIVGGLAVAFLFLSLLVSFFVGGPLLLFFYLMVGMGSGLP